MDELLNSLKNNNEKFSEEYYDIMKEYYSKIKNQEGAQLNKPDSEGGMLILPNVHCCVKTHDSSGQKIFINILHHEKIEQPKEENILELENQYGIRLPLSLSEKYEDFDNKNNICQVYDVIFNTNVVKKSETDVNIFTLMFQFTLERIKQRFNHVLSLNYIKLKNLKYKGKTVRYQRVRVRTGPKIEEIIKDPEIKSINEKNIKEINHEVNERGKSPNWNFIILKNLNMNDENMKYINSLDLIGKNYTIEEFYHNSTNNLFLYYDGYNANPRDGAALLFIIELNIITKTNALKLNISDEGFIMNCGKIYSLEITFPFKVNSSEANSYFETNKRLLYIILPFYESDRINLSNENNNSNNVKISDEYLYDVLI